MFYSVYDPPYLTQRAKPIPSYETLHVSLKGYDSVALDTFHAHCVELCRTTFGISDAKHVTNVHEQHMAHYAMPLRTYHCKTLQPHNVVLPVQDTTLPVYHRVLALTKLRSTLAPLLFEALQLSLPEGVSMSVTVPTEDDEEFRYVPQVSRALTNSFFWLVLKDKTGINKIKRLCLFEAKIYSCRAEMLLLFVVVVSFIELKSNL